MRVLLSLACAVIIVAGLKAAAELFIPIMLGLFLAMLSMPILNWLDRRGLPRALAVLTTILVDMLILGGILFLASGVVGEFQDKSGEYAEKLRRQTAQFTETMDGQLDRLGTFWNRAGEAIGDDSGESPDAESENGSGSDDESGDPAFSDATIPTFQELFERYWDTARVVEFIGQTDVVARFTSLTSKAFFALIVMIFVLAESGRYAEKVRDVMHVSGPDLSRFQNSTRDIQKYLGIKTGVSAATGLLALVACVAFRVDFPLLWGLVAFLFNYVPAIGSIVAGIPPVLLALILHGFWPAAGVLTCYVIINVTIGNFVEPMLLGDRFGISTVIVILSVLTWGYIWGPVGMLLAVPLTMVVKVMLDNSSDLRWISALMGKSGLDTIEEEIGPRDAPEDTPESTT